MTHRYPLLSCALPASLPTVRSKHLTQGTTTVSQVRLRKATLAQKVQKDPIPGQRSVSKMQLFSCPPNGPQ